MSDWRVDLAKHTAGAKLRFAKCVAPRPDWDHDHCAACTAKFMESGDGVLTEGYRTEDAHYWICAKCYSDLRGEMGWDLYQAME